MKWNFDVKLHLTNIPPKRQSALAAMLIMTVIIATVAPVCLAALVLL